MKCATEVYNLASDMGGMGFIERFRVECLRSILINTHMIEAADRAGVARYFYSSSACADVPLGMLPKSVLASFAGSILILRLGLGKLLIDNLRKRGKG